MASCWHGVSQGQRLEHGPRAREPRAIVLKNELDLRFPVPLEQYANTPSLDPLLPWDLPTFRVLSVSRPTCSPFVVLSLGSSRRVVVVSGGPPETPPPLPPFDWTALDRLSLFYWTAPPRTVFLGGGRRENCLLHLLPLTLEPRASPLHPAPPFSDLCRLSPAQVPGPLGQDTGKVWDYVVLCVPYPQAHQGTMFQDSSIG